MKTHNNSLYIVDFKNKKLLSKSDVSIEVKPNSMKNFNTPPIESNFHYFSDFERTQHSDHILEHFKDFSFQDILHFIEMGVLDKEKVAIKLGLSFKINEESA